MGSLQIALVLIAAAPPAEGAAAAIAPADLNAFYQRVLPSVVVIDILDGMGGSAGQASGFFVSASGLMVTNCHVVDDAEALDAVLSAGGRRRVAGVVAKNCDQDIALLKVEGGGFTPLELASLDDAAAGVPVINIGNPKGFGWSMSNGIISGVRSIADRDVEEGAKYPLKGTVIQFTAPATHGSSGSPVFLHDGRVVGVVEGGYAEGNIEFAIPADDVRKLMDLAGPEPRVTPLSTPPWRNLAISLGVFAAVGAYFYLRARSRKPSSNLSFS